MIASSLRRVARYALAGSLLLVAACAGASSCPKDLLNARGKACAIDGMACGTTPGFTHLLMCSRGKWTEMDAPPPPPPPPRAP